MPAVGRTRPIDGTTLKDYLVCPRLAWFRLHPPDEQPDPPPPQLAVFLEAGRRFEAERLREVDAEDLSEEPAGPEGIRATLEALAGGRSVRGGVVGTGGRLGRPDLLLRTDEGRVRVVEIKSSAAAGAAAKLQAAFYRRLLEADAAEVPGLAVDPNAAVWLRGAPDEVFPAAGVAASLDRVLDRLDAFAAAPGGSDPGPHAVAACASCIWRSLCAREREEAGHLSLVPSLTRAQADALRAAGCETVADLAAAAPKRLAARSGLLPDVVRRLRLGAQAVLEGAPLRLQNLPPDVARARLFVLALVHDRVRPAAVAVAGRVCGEGGGARVRFVRSPEAEDPERELGSFLYRLSRTDGPLVTYGRGLVDLFERTSPPGRRAARAMSRLRERLVDLRLVLRRSFALPAPIDTLDRAARLFGAPEADEGVALRSLRHLEGLADDPAAVVERLERETERLVALRDLACADRFARVRGENA